MSDPLRIPVRLRIAGGAPLDAEIEIDDPGPLGARVAEPDVLVEEALAARWRCSRRTLKRLRDRKVLPFHRAGRGCVYRLADVQAVEAGGASRAARSGAR